MAKMPELREGLKAPAFSLPTDGGGTVALKDLKCKTLVLYFYPKDDTPGCTREAMEFGAAKAKFTRAGAVVVGVSKDSVAKHDKFKSKYALNFALASDETGEMLERYGVWVEKSMYGRKYMGIDRATFVIGPDGKIKKIWRKVKVPGHVDEVLEVVKGLAAAG